jgi:hypothetical protein
VLSNNALSVLVSILEETRGWHVEKQITFSEMSVLKRLRKVHEERTDFKNSEWNISFWFVVLWPLIVVAIVAIGFLAPALIKTL